MHNVKLFLTSAFFWHDVYSVSRSGCLCTGLDTNLLSNACTLCTINTSNVQWIEHQECVPNVYMYTITVEPLYKGHVGNREKCPL